MLQRRLFRSGYTPCRVSSVCALLGPNANLSSSVLLVALCECFTSLFTFGDITIALTSTTARVPNFPYFFTTAMGLFKMGAIEYLKDASGKPLRERARKVVERSGYPKPSINSVVKTLKTLEKP